MNSVRRGGFIESEGFGRAGLGYLNDAPLYNRRRYVVQKFFWMLGRSVEASRLPPKYIRAPVTRRKLKWNNICPMGKLCALRSFVSQHGVAQCTGFLAPYTFPRKVRCDNPNNNRKTRILTPKVTNLEPQYSPSIFTASYFLSGTTNARKAPSNLNPGLFTSTFPAISCITLLSNQRRLYKTSRW